MDANDRQEQREWNDRTREKIVRKLKQRTDLYNQAIDALNVMRSAFDKANHEAVTGNIAHALTCFANAEDLLESGDEYINRHVAGKTIYCAHYGESLNEADQGYVYLQEILDYKEKLETLRSESRPAAKAASERFAVIRNHADDLGLLDEVDIKTYIDDANQFIRRAVQELRSPRPHYLRANSWLISANVKLNEVARRTEAKRHLVTTNRRRKATSSR